ncbi:MAG: paraquat-inducible protein A [Bacteroidia bacterium]|jgi:paraquat-inducible protein A
MNDQIACNGCDLLVDVGGMADGERASCPRCGCSLTTYRADSYDRILAFSIAGLVLLVVASSFPFLSFAAGGIESVMTLPQTPGAIWRYGMPFMSVLVAAFIIFIPAVVLLLLLALSSALRSGRNYPWLVQVARWIFTWQSWSMVEVFIIGVIVSLVKIASMATVVLGVSFWAYAGFAICFTAASVTLDRYRCWEDIEALNTNE